MKLFVALCVVLCGEPLMAQTEENINAIKKTLESWNRGWAEKDVDLAIQDYAENVDWTNAFGDRFTSRHELKKGLEFIFSLDFVMAGTSGKNEFEDIKFLTKDIALFRSKLVRTGQKTAQGTLMPDRHVHHLRVLKRIDGNWKIISHLISQAQPKTMSDDDRR